MCMPVRTCLPTDRHAHTHIAVHSCTPTCNCACSPTLTNTQRHIGAHVTQTNANTY